MNQRCADETTDCSTNGDAACTGIGNGKCGFAGYRDWRVPSLNELHSVANYGNNSPAVSTEFNDACVASCTVTTCSCTQSFLYWSSTTAHVSPDAAWAVDFNVGNVLADGKGVSYYVRAVRGGL